MFALAACQEPTRKANFISLEGVRLAGAKLQLEARAELRKHLTEANTLQLGGVVGGGRATSHSMR